jgi:hypothetical protein
VSSISYWAELHPEARLRRVVLVSGMLLLAGGVAMVCLIDGPPTWKIAGGVMWFGVSAFRLWQLGHAYVENGILRIAADGTLEIEGMDGRRRTASLASGSFAVQRFAWLRISLPSGATYAELVRGTARESEEWRRFQVIWRHIGAHS